MPLNRNLLKETMSVLVNGHEETRFVSHYEDQHGMRVPVPECHDDETYRFILGDTRPIMVKIR
jgi:hypothetical protein